MTRGYVLLFDPATIPDLILNIVFFMQPRSLGVRIIAARVFMSQLFIDGYDFWLDDVKIRCYGWLHGKPIWICVLEFPNIWASISAAVWLVRVGTHRQMLWKWGRRKNWGLGYWILYLWKRLAFFVNNLIFFKYHRTSFSEACHSSSYLTRSFILLKNSSNSTYFLTLITPMNYEILII